MSVKKILLVGAVVMTACSADVVSDATTPPSAPTPPTVTVPPVERVPGMSVPRITGEVPASLLAPVLADAATRLAASADALTVVRSQQVTFSDGSLGCPQPGQMYTQALVDGYWVEIEAGDRTLDYRLTRRGVFTLCEGGAPPTAPGPTG